MSTKQRITQLQNELQEKKKSYEQSKFQIQHCLETLKEQHGCPTIDAANKKLTVLKKKITSLDLLIENKLQEVEHECNMET